MTAKAVIFATAVAEGVTAAVSAVSIMVVIMKSMHFRPFLDISIMQIYLSCIETQGRAQIIFGIRR
jgi:hypothetical protein